METITIYRKNQKHRYTLKIELLALLHIVQWIPPESARVWRSLADSGGLTRPNWTVLPLPKVFVDQSPV